MVLAVKQLCLLEMHECVNWCAKHIRWQKFRLNNLLKYYDRKVSLFFESWLLTLEYLWKALAKSYAELKDALTC